MSVPDTNAIRIFRGAPPTCPVRQYPIIKGFGPDDKSITNDFCCNSNDAYTPTTCQNFANAGKLGKPGEQWATTSTRINPKGITNCDGCFGGCTSCGIGRSYMQCVKTQWPTTNRVPCCTRKLDSAEDCDPEWCPGTTTCQNALKEFCTQNNSENMNKEECRNVCGEYSGKTDETRQWCDTSARQYCSIHREDTAFCGCLNSNVANALKCFTPDCQIGGGTYIPDELKSFLQTCATKEGCITAINCNPGPSGTCNIDNNLFNQQCGQYGVTLPGEGTTGPTGPGGPVGPTRPPGVPVGPTTPTFITQSIEFIKKNWIYFSIGGGVLLLLIILLIIFVVVRKR